MQYGLKFLAKENAVPDVDTPLSFVDELEAELEKRWKQSKQPGSALSPGELALMVIAVRLKEIELIGPPIKPAGIGLAST